MNFISLQFFAFFAIFIVLSSFTPVKYRYLLILAGSLYFYGSADPKLLLFLGYSIVVTYLGGLAIERRRSKSVLALFLILNLGALVGVKYAPGIVLPVGMSFYVFQSTTYLMDLYRGKIKQEKNFLLYAAFVSFFPTVLSGPIQKARELLPQLKKPKTFDSDDMKKGTILFIWGCFEKLLISNSLFGIISYIYNEEATFTAPYYILAMICFSLYIYADFSAYSDMARGTAKMIGINVGKNFDNPYLSLSLSEFWNRWHRSLNRWFLENLYIPLGGNRKGTIRKYINILIVFTVSGMWHGAFLHFVIWGAVNGILVVIEGIAKPLQQKIYALLKIDPDLESIVFLKRARVFAFITFTWLFFETGVSQSLDILGTIAHGRFIDFFDEGLLAVSGSTTATILTIAFTLVFVVVQCKRRVESHYYEMFDRQPLLLQGLLMAFVIVVCVFAAFQSMTTVNTQFLYFQF